VPEVAGLGVKGGVDLDHRTSNGITALMAAAHRADSTRLAALLKAGCNPLIVTEKRGWNILHFILHGGHHGATHTIHSMFGGTPHMAGIMVGNLHGGTAGEKRNNKWAKQKYACETVLSSVSRGDAAQLLCAAKAEHTPLMFAMWVGADAGIVHALAETMSADAELNNALMRRDKQMNTATHLGVAAELEPAAIENLLKAALAAGPSVASALGPRVENSRGVTPLETVIDGVAHVWGKQAQASHHHFHFNPVARCSNPRAAKDEGMKLVQASQKWRQHTLLKEVESTDERDQHRVMISFDEVQQAAESGTKEADESVGNHSFTQDDDIMVPSTSFLTPSSQCLHGMHQINSMFPTVTG